MDNKIILEEVKKKQAQTIKQLVASFQLGENENNELIQQIDQMINEYQLVLENDKLYTGESKGFYSGRIRINRRGFGFLDFPERPSIFVGKQQLEGVYDLDAIVVKVKTGDDDGKLVKVIARHLTQVVGTIYTRRSPYKFITDNSNYENKIKIDNVDKFKRIHNHKVLVKIVDYKANHMVGMIIDDLGDANDPGVDVMAVLIEDDIRVDWPDNVKEMIKDIPEQLSADDLKDRTDLRDELIFTIDGDDAKDLDDAISIERLGNDYRLSVHIADVSHYVKEGNPIDVEASERGTSVYVTDRVVSMLPKELSNGICSLHPNVDRLALSVRMVINQSGNVKDYQVFPSVINSKYRMTYNNVNKILADEDSVPEYRGVINEIRLMQELTAILAKKRVELGAIDFDKDEADIIVNQEGKVTDIVLAERGLSEVMIENFMVTTNEVIARVMKWSEWPALYRVHEKPDPDKMRDFASLAKILGYNLKGKMEDIHPQQLQKLLKEAEGTDNQIILAGQLLRSMQKARYDYRCLGHFGLGSKEYSHFTSPIRRYPDLLVHRMIRKYLFNHDYKDLQDDIATMSEMGVQTSLLERKAIKAERDVNDMKMAEYMEGKIGEIHNGVISSVHNFGMFIQLENLVEGLIRTDSLVGNYKLSPDGFTLEDIANHKKYRIGDRIKIIVKGANKRSRNVDFELFVKKENVKIKTQASKKPKTFDNKASRNQRRRRK